MPVTDPEKKQIAQKARLHYENLLYMRSTKPHECKKMPKVP